MTKIEFYNKLQQLHNSCSDEISQARYYFIRYERSGEILDKELAEVREERYADLQMELTKLLIDKSFADTMDAC